jgi:hypothetical protein
MSKSLISSMDFMKTFFVITGFLLFYSGISYADQIAKTFNVLHNNAAPSIPYTPNNGNIVAENTEALASISVLTPNGGEFIPSGSLYTTRWETSPETEKFDLLYSLNNGTTWKKIVSTGRSSCLDCHSGSNNVWFTCTDCHIIHPHTGGCTDCHSISAIHDIHANTNVQSYNWQVPCPKNNKKQCLFKVIGYDLSDRKIGEDVSDLPFTIEVIYLVSPNGGQRLPSGYTWTIRWQTNCTKKPVAKVELKYTSGGGLWNLITTLDGNHGTYPWTVPNVSSAKCKVKVVLKDANGSILGQDVSDGFFTIYP